MPPYFFTIFASLRTRRIPYRFTIISTVPTLQNPSGQHNAILFIASINTTMLMQPLRLWSVRMPCIIPPSKGLLLDAISCSLSPVLCIPAYLIWSSCIFRLVVVIGSQRAPAPSRHLAVAILVSFRKPSSAALPLVVLKRSDRIA
jgi:hypothetical protein